MVAAGGAERAPGLQKKKTFADFINQKGGQTDAKDRQIIQKNRNQAARERQKNRRNGDKRESGREIVLEEDPYNLNW